MSGPRSQGDNETHWENLPATGPIPWLCVQIDLHNSPAALAFLVPLTSVDALFLLARASECTSASAAIVDYCRGTLDQLPQLHSLNDKER